MKFVTVALLSLLAVAGCGSGTTPVASPDPSVGAPSRVIQEFVLSTHCGIREAKVDNDFYTASPLLFADGNRTSPPPGWGNPPKGWGNPVQVGTMTVYEDGTAHFSAPGGLEADFRLRPGATTSDFHCA
jgi:hypothetical protein